MLRDSIYSDFSGPTGDTRVKGLTFSKFLTLRCNSVLHSRKKKKEGVERGRTDTFPSLKYRVNGLIVSLCHAVAGMSYFHRGEKNTYSMSRRYLCSHAETRV